MLLFPPYPVSTRHPSGLLSGISSERKGNEIFYWKGKGEVDFLLRKGTSIEKLINVCWDLNEKNKTRECSGLREAMDKFTVRDAEIVTAGYGDSIKFEGREIGVRNIFDWFKDGE